MIYLSQITPFPVEANDDTLAVARENTRKILEIINNPLATDFDIMVDIGGVIFLAPYNGENELNGSSIITPPNNANRATWSLTFQYGASFATSDEQATIMKIKNFQVEASEKAFLFESIDEDTRVNVTDLYNSEVSVCWFGAVADCNNTQDSIDVATDNHAPFDAAIKCFKNIADPKFEWKNVVNIPASLGLNFNLYCLKSPLIIHSSVQLVGIGMVKSQLVFPNTGGGITISENNIGGKLAIGCEISNLTLFGPLFITDDLPPLPTYDKGNGITIRAACSIKEVKVASFDGNGIHLSANVAVPPASNANGTQLFYVDCRNNSINGILVDTAGGGSGDTNACLITSASVTSNGACGIRDQSFLGNTYIGCHSATNSKVSNNRSRVYKIGGERYICIQDNDGTINPGVSIGWANY
jgi:hypothetical protein